MIRQPIVPLVLFAASLAGAAPVSAQSSLRVVTGEKANDRLGVSCALAGNVDADGRPDYIIGVPEDGNALVLGEGYARVFSGATGAVLLTLHGLAADDLAGRAVGGAGDVNGDGRADLIVGAPGGESGLGRVTIHSGLNGAVLRTIVGLNLNEQLGFSVAGLGDVNLDSVPDLIAGSPVAAAGGSNRGLARVYSGADGAVLHTIQGTLNGDRVGHSVAAVGDVNGDGQADFLVGSLYAGARLCSGASGAVLRLFTGAALDRLGTAVAGCGDVNGDGVPDVIIGAPQDGNVLAPGNGYARIHDGATGALIRTLNGSAAGDRFGISVTGLGDLDGDGRAEVAVGADQTLGAGNGYVRVFRGSDGAALHTVTGTSTTERFASAIAGLGDVDGDGTREVLVGAPNASQGFALAGRAQVWSLPDGGCLQPYTYCIGALNSTGQPALMSFSGTVRISLNDLVVRCSGLPPSGAGLFYHGSLETQAVFGNGYRCVGGSTARLSVQSADGSGSVQRAINVQTVSGGPFVPGQTRKFQYWYRNPAAGGAGYNLSNGLSVTFCN